MLHPNFIIISSSQIKKNGVALQIKFVKIICLALNYY